MNLKVLSKIIRLIAREQEVEVILFTGDITKVENREKKLVLVDIYTNEVIGEAIPLANEIALIKSNGKILFDNKEI